MKKRKLIPERAAKSASLRQQGRAIRAAAEAAGLKARRSRDGLWQFFEAEGGQPINANGMDAEEAHAFVAHRRSRGDEPELGEMEGDIFKEYR